MPWDIVKRGDEWCVINRNSRESEGCHASEAKAKRQLRALYASENQGGTMNKRELASIPVEIAQVATSGRTLKGWASVFDHPIMGPGYPNVTTYMKPGAFKKTLQENKSDVQVLFNHGMDSRYGELPIGTVTDLHEKPQGLWAEVELHDGPDNQNIIAALRSGALRAMSIQFEPLQETYSEDHTERYIRQVRLFEFGPVTFPANAAATASLHSLASFAKLLDPQDAGDNIEPDKAQAESSAGQDRESILDPDRLTWSLEAAALRERWEREQREIAERIARLREGGSDGDHPRTDPAASRQAG
jgi:HK97 family phage prohead protease